MTDTLQHRWCLEPTIMDRHWHRLASLPRRHPRSKQTASASFQKLDLPLGPVVLSHPQFFPRPSSRLEQLQSVLQCRDVCQPLCGIAHHAGHVCGMEGAEAHQGCKTARDGSGDGYVSSGEF